MNVLFHSIFIDLEIRFLEVEHQASLLVENRKGNLDFFDFNLKELLVLRLLVRAR